MPLPLESLKRSALELWHDTPAEHPRASTTYSALQQIQKEQEVDRLMKKTDESVGDMRSLKGEKKTRLLAVRSRIQQSIIQLLHSFDCVIDDDMEKSFSGVTDEFIRRAYDFDPAISEESVYQAARNVMIMNTFQMHLGKEVALTPSVFAYSMLYPYTDNYLDAAGIGRESKQEANHRLQLRLNGIKTPTLTHRERMVDRLVGMIEGEFDRRSCAAVYESLLAIHHAQCRSVGQQEVIDPISDHDLLDISIEKGGTSVIADGYLVASELAPSDVEFFYRFGVLLQLIDDLQDLVEDDARNQRTLAGATAHSGRLEEFTNRLLSLIPAVLEPARTERHSLHQLIERSCRLLILEAIASNRSYYSDEYLVAMERHSSVRFGYLRSVKRRMRGKFDSPGNQPIHKRILQYRDVKKRTPGVLLPF